MIAASVRYWHRHDVWIIGMVIRVMTSATTRLLIVKVRRFEKRMETTFILASFLPYRMTSQPSAANSLCEWRDTIRPRKCQLEGC